MSAARGRRPLAGAIFACALAGSSLVGISPATASPPSATRPAAAAAGPTAAYTASRDGAIARGRALVGLAKAGDAPAIHAQLVPSFRAQITKEQIAALLRQLRADLIGARVVENALPVDVDQVYYSADHRTSDRRVLTLTAVFDGKGVAGIELRQRVPLPPDPKAGYRMRSKLQLPFKGQWWVFWGGNTELQNYHVIAADQRHAFDLLIWRNGSTHRGAGLVNSDYYVWNHRVRAPAAAIVVAAVDGVRDNRPQVEVSNQRDPAGNHVVLKLADGEYALLAHLRQGSVRVNVGQRVRSGQILGLAGNSGNTSEPHLHFHVQDVADLFGAARGLPVRFEDYVADGSRVAAGSPVQGQFISSRG